MGRESGDINEVKLILMVELVLENCITESLVWPQ